MLSSFSSAMSGGLGLGEDPSFFDVGEDGWRDIPLPVLTPPSSPRSKRTSVEDSALPSNGGSESASLLTRFAAAFHSMAYGGGGEEKAAGNVGRSTSRHGRFYSAADISATAAALGEEERLSTKQLIVLLEMALEEEEEEENHRRHHQEKSTGSTDSLPPPHWSTSEDDHDNRGSGDPTPYSQGNRMRRSSFPALPITYYRGTGADGIATDNREVGGQEVATTKGLAKYYSFRGSGSGSGSGPLGPLRPVTRRTRGGPGAGARDSARKGEE
ncbi:unnamed protein product, partial [Discosporangium mesarthrocarpum]